MFNNTSKLITGLQIESVGSPFLSVCFGTGKHSLPIPESLTIPETLRIPEFFTIPEFHGALMRHQVQLLLAQQPIHIPAGKNLRIGETYDCNLPFRNF